MRESYQKQYYEILERLINNPNKKRPSRIGNIHGNQPIGGEILLHLMDYMLNNQSQDENVEAISSEELTPMIN